MTALSGVPKTRVQRDMTESKNMIEEETLETYPMQDCACSAALLPGLRQPHAEQRLRVVGQRVLTVEPQQRQPREAASVVHRVQLQHAHVVGDERLQVLQLRDVIIQPQSLTRDQTVIIWLKAIH